MTKVFGKNGLQFDNLADFLRAIDPLKPEAQARLVAMLLRDNETYNDVIREPEIMAWIYRNSDTIASLTYAAGPSWWDRFIPFRALPGNARGPNDAT